MGKKWCLIQPSTGKKMYGVTDSEVEVLKYAVNEIEINNWYAWQEGWDNWKKLSELKSFKAAESIQRQDIQPPNIDRSNRVKDPLFVPNQITSQTLNKEIKAEDVSSEDLAIEDDGGAGYYFREHTRLRKRFKAIIINGEKQFKTYTVDISAGGALLEDPLPKWVVGYNNLTLINLDKKQQVHVACAVVDGQSEDKRFRIIISPFENESKLKKFKDWLEAC